MNTLADDTWATMTALVMDGRVDWRKQVMSEVGMPFSRVRVLRRLVDGPLTMKGLAEAAMTDAPAATVAVNDLEKRGLVVRTITSDNRRVKEVSLTELGRETLARVDAIRPAAPTGIRALSDADLTTLRDLLKRIAADPS